MSQTIVIDAGHGGSDSGALGNGLREKDLTLTIALGVANFLRQTGADIRLIRSTDTTLSLTQRTAFANSIGADYYLSIHINAGGGTGFESYLWSGPVDSTTTRVRDAIHQKTAAYFASFGLRDRGKKTADFHVLRESKMPACLLECGFIDNATDATRLKNSSFLEGLAKAIGQGVATGLGLTVAPGEPAQISKYFVDVVKGMEHAVPHIDSLFEKGIILGDGKGHFLPKNTVDRLTLAVVVDRAIEYILSQINK